MSSERPNYSSVIKEASARKLFKLLNSIDGSKDLILDHELICSLDFIANFSQLKACNVEKIYKLEPGSAPGATKKCVYIVKPSVSNTKIIADHINASLSIESGHRFWIIYVPRKLCTSKLILEREGVYGNAKLLDLPIGFLVLDDDIFSLEIPKFFEAFYLKGDLTHIHTCASALVQLFQVCGSVPKVFGQGRCSKMVMDLANEMIEKTDLTYNSLRVSDLIIVDRVIDCVSVLLSQLTYEGMLDDFFGIKSGKTTFPKIVTTKEPVKVILNSSDVVFNEIRNKHFASVFGYLRNKAKELQAKKDNTSTMSVLDMRTFISKEMKNFQQQQTSLSLHIGACEIILAAKNRDDFQDRLRIESDILNLCNLKECIEYTEDLISIQEPFGSPLKLMCLMSISQGGLMSNEFSSLITQFRQSYGCEHLITLFRLKELGLLMEQPPLLPPSNVRQSKLTEVAAKQATQIAEKVVTAVAFPKFSSFKTITKKFNLIPPDERTTDLKNPQNMSYVFGGTYVPLIGRITEQVILNSTFKHLEEGLKLLPEPTFTQCESEKKSGYIVPPTEINSRTVIVYILGGITYAEVAALRLLGKLNNCNILIATTSFINGDTLFSMLAPKVD